MSNRAAPPELIFRGARYTLVGSLGPQDLSAEHVANVLAAQPGNRKGRLTADRLKAKWVVSEHFTLTDVYAAMPQFGVTANKSGKSASEGLPIIIDENVRKIAKLKNGYTPPFMVLDGQNRTTAARRHNDPSIKLQAFVGNRILDQVRRLVRAWEIKHGL